VHILFDPETNPLPAPRSGLTATDFFPWEELEGAVAQVRDGLARKEINKRGK